MFVMWRTTRDVKWRERGWQIWTAIENKTRTSSGYASVMNVDQPNPYKLDSMPRWVRSSPSRGQMVSLSNELHRLSYFLSETIKYAYLLAIDEDPWPVDKFVFTTEAHPLPIFEWRPLEKSKYGVA
jgi:mannosyl-oligosaccharide alpha-1,2-mannosidase